MGNGLRKLRDERGWTAEQAAERAGYSRSGYVKVERSERGLSSDKIKLFMSVFGASEREVMGESNTAPKRNLLMAALESAFGECLSDPETGARLAQSIIELVDEPRQTEGVDLELAIRVRAQERALEHIRRAWRKQNAPREAERPLGSPNYAPPSPRPRNLGK